MSSPVPLLDLKREYNKIRGTVDQAIARVLESQVFILGPEVECFEKEIGAYLRAEHTLGVSSGTDALLLALMALDIGPGDEVITSAYSFFATAGSIARLGATPIFVDIDPVSFNLQPKLVEQRINSRTKAIIPVHLFGQLAAMGALTEIAQRFSLPLIEDAAQSFGARYKGEIKSRGTIACFSFFPSKNLSCYGDGGLISTDNGDLFNKMRALRAHGQFAGKRYVHEILGGNFRLDALQAAILRAKLTNLDDALEGRRANAAFYNEHLLSLERKGLLRLPHEHPDCFHTFNQYVICSEHRESLIAALTKAEIGYAIYYPSPLPQQPCFKHLASANERFPVSEEISKQNLALPIFPGLTQSELERVVELIHGALNSKLS